MGVRLNEILIFEIWNISILSIPYPASFILLNRVFLFSCNKAQCRLEKITAENWLPGLIHGQHAMAATKFTFQGQKYYYTSEDFKWPRLCDNTEDCQNKYELSKVN